MAAIELEKTFDAEDDHASEYARRNLDREWAAHLQRQAAEGGGPEIRGAPGKGTEDVPAPAPAPAPAEATTPEWKSTFGAAIDALFANVKEGLATALKPGPLSMESAKEVVMGGMQAALAPLAGLAAGLGQGIENIAPEAMGAVVLEGGPNGPAFTARHLAMGAPDVKTLPPEQVAALSQPMTGREAVELAVQQVPFAAPMAKKGATAVKMQAPELRGQRGSIGPAPPPEPAGLKGAPRPGEVPSAAVPSLTPPPGAEARINVARQIAPDAVKQVMTDISKVISTRPEIIESRRTVSHTETIAEAATWKLDKVLATEPGDLTLNQVRGFQHAARDFFNAASHHLNDLKERVKAGDAEAAAQWDVAELVLGRLAALQEMPGTELARSLEARSIPATMERAPGFTPEAIQRIVAMKAGTDVPPQVSVAMYEALPAQAQRTEYLRQKWEAYKRFINIPHQIWINNLLTNPVTHSANVAGTGLAIAWDIPETYTAEIVNRLFFRDAAGVQRGEAAAKVRGIVQGLTDGFRLARKTAAKEFGREAGLTGTEEALIGRNLVEVQQDLPPLLRIPTIALGIEDAAAKGLVYRMELKALALRQAMNEGKIGAALEARVTELEAHPPGPMIAEAVDAAMLRTLNAELGPMGQAFMRLANTAPGGRVVFPFIRTPTNGAKWWGQRSPILAQLSAQNWRDITAGGAARDKAIARQVLGAAAASVIAYYVVNGTITGPGTKDKRFTDVEREARPRNSICVKGACYEYSRLDPVGGLFNLVATYVSIAGQIPVQDDLDEWAAYGEAVALAVGHVLVNKTSMQGFSDVLEAIEDPHRNVGKVAKGWARSIVPAGVRALARTQDDNIIREAQGLVDQIKTGLPYIAPGLPSAGDVPAHRNPITGEPVRLPEGWGPDMLSPVFITRLKNDPVFNEIVANHIALTPVPWYIGPGERGDGPMMQEPRGGIRAVKLTPEQRDYWIVAMTQLAKDGEGRTLHKALTALVTSESYKNQSTGPGGGREARIKLLYNTYRDLGAKMLLRHPQSTVLQRVQEVEEDKVRRLLPRTDPRSPQYGKPVKLGVPLSLGP